MLRILGFSCGAAGSVVGVRSLHFRCPEHATENSLRASLRLSMHVCMRAYHHTYICRRLCVHVNILRSLTVVAMRSVKHPSSSAVTWRGATPMLMKGLLQAPPVRVTVGHQVITARFFDGMAVKSVERLVRNAQLVQKRKLVKNSTLRRSVAPCKLRIHFLRLPATAASHCGEPTSRCRLAVEHAEEGVLVLASAYACVCRRINNVCVGPPMDT